MLVSTFVSVRVFVVRLGARARSNGAQAERRGRAGCDRTGVIAPPAGGAGVRPAGMLTPSIGSPKTAASSSAFSCEPAHVGRRREVVELRLDERLADRDGTRADPKLAREVAVEPLAVLEEVGVAVLVAGAGDERRPLAARTPAPSRAAGTRSGARRRRRGCSPQWQPALKTSALARFTVEAASSVVSTLVEKSAARALLALKWPARKITSWRLPSSFADSWEAVHDSGILRRLVCRGDQRVRTWRPCRAWSSVGDGVGRIREEVVAGDERRARGDDAVRLRVGVDAGRRSPPASRRAARRRGPAPGRSSCAARRSFRPRRRPG